MIYLHVFSPVWELSDASPFAAHTIQPDYQSRMKKFIKTLPNLTGYWERLTSMLHKA